MFKIKLDCLYRRLLQLFALLFTIVALYILSIIIFRVNDGRIKIFSSSGVTPEKVIIGVIIEIILFLFILFFLNKVSDKFLKYLSIINLIIVTALAVSFGFILITTPQWDFGSVYREAVFKAVHGTKYLSEYFYQLFPNNIFITMILYWIYKFFTIFGIHNFDQLSISINIIFIMISVIATYFLIKDIYGLKIATIASFLFITLTPIYAYAPIFYTDTFTMMYLPLIYLLFRKYLKTNKFYYLIIMGILGALGVGIKNNIAIGLISLFIFALLVIRDYKKFLKFFVIFCISFGIIYTGISSICQANIPIPMSKAGFPYTHWVMMGLNKSSTGSWDAKDYHGTLAFVPNKVAMKNFNEKIIKERLENFGPFGYIDFLNKKASFTWQSGDLYAATVVSQGTNNTNSLLYKYVLGAKQGGFLLFSQIGFAVLFIFVILGGLLSIRDNDLTFILFNITIFGVFVFLLLWEAEPRYILCILPIIIASGSSFFAKVDGIFNKSKN